MKRVRVAFLVLALLVPCMVYTPAHAEGQKVMTPAEEQEYQELQRKLLRVMLKEAYLAGCMEGNMAGLIGMSISEQKAEAQAVQEVEQIAKRHEVMLLRLTPAE